VPVNKTQKGYLCLYASCVRVIVGCCYSWCCSFSSVRMSEQQLHRCATC